MFAAPIDWIFQYMRRPRSVITKSEFIERARGLAHRATEIKVGTVSWVARVHMHGVWRAGLALQPFEAAVLLAAPAALCSHACGVLSCRPQRTC
jgi:hypothetical protein